MALVLTGPKGNFDMDEQVNPRASMSSNDCSPAADHHRYKKQIPRDIQDKHKIAKPHKRPILQSAVVSANYKETRLFIRFKPLKSISRNKIRIKFSR
jgi:hypothetical protein